MQRVHRPAAIMAFACLRIKDIAKLAFFSFLVYFFLFCFWPLRRWDAYGVQGVLLFFAFFFQDL